MFMSLCTVQPVGSITASKWQSQGLQDSSKNVSYVFYHGTYLMVTGLALREPYVAKRGNIQHTSESVCQDVKSILQPSSSSGEPIVLGLRCKKNSQLVVHGPHGQASCDSVTLVVIKMEKYTFYASSHCVDKVVRTQPWSESDPNL